MEKIEKEKDREIIKAYFGIGKEFPLTGESLAQEFGMSKVGVSKLINRTINQLSSIAV